ncbi:major facilitator superfamily domain-containing protein [Apiospora kogelbergensis]|uniref:major facilitator superfamily domain-containing protein n=1 Tax=Apiospora kogelbergensis TaxID=1337665 RepID=UPI00312FDAE6
MDPASNPTVHLQNLPPGYLQSRTSSSIRYKAADKDAVNQEARVHSKATSNGHCLADGGHGDGELEAGQTPPLDTYTVELDFPEGGLRAWLVVASAFSMAFASFGFMVSIGTLQDYWHMHQLSHLSSRDVGWIPSVFTYLSLALGLWVGPLFDHYGPRWIALVGSVGYLLMVFLLAECTQFWHFLLCCGVLGGTSGAALTTTPLAVVAHWFNRRRGFAQGVVMIGSSFGGLTLPLILQATLPRYGYAWSIRILGLIFTGCLLVSNLLMKARIPPLRHRGGAGGERNKSPKSFPLAIFGDLRFTLLTVSVFGFEVVLFSALGILPTYASLANPSYPPETTGFYLIAILNGVSCLGRLGPGWLADKVGRFNMLLAMTVFTLFWMLALWLPLGQSSLAALYAFAGLFGFGTGGWMALTPACVGQLCRADEFGRYYGTMYFVASLATLICIPVSGELVESVGPTAYVVFLCAVLAVSLVSFVFSRWACLDRRWLLVAKV